MTYLCLVLPQPAHVDLSKRQFETLRLRGSNRQTKPFHLQKTGIVQRVHITLHYLDIAVEKRIAFFGARAGQAPRAGLSCCASSRASPVLTKGFHPWRERPLRGRMAVQQRRPRRPAGRDGDGAWRGECGACHGSQDQAGSPMLPASPAPMGCAHEVKRGTARRRSDWSRCLRLQWRSGASFIGAAMPSTARSGGFWTCFGHGRRSSRWRFSCRCNPGQALV